MVPSVGKEGDEIARVVEGYEVKVEIERLDGIRAIKLEAEENVCGGGVIEAELAMLEVVWRGGDMMGEDFFGFRDFYHRRERSDLDCSRKRDGFHLKLLQMDLGLEQDLTWA